MNETQLVHLRPGFSVEIEGGPGTPVRVSIVFAGFSRFGIEMDHGKARTIGLHLLGAASDAKPDQAERPSGAT